MTPVARCAQPDCHVTSLMPYRPHAKSRATSRADSPYVAVALPTSLGALAMSSLEIFGHRPLRASGRCQRSRKLQRRARQHPLTEFGYALFHEELRARLAWPPTGRRLALLMSDVDDFKLINDRSGHPEASVCCEFLSAALVATILEVADFQEAHIAGRIIAAARTGPTTRLMVSPSPTPAEQPTSSSIAPKALWRAKRPGGDTARLSVQSSASRRSVDTC